MNSKEEPYLMLSHITEEEADTMKRIKAIIVTVLLAILLIYSVFLFFNAYKYELHDKKIEEQKK
jgi:hypothetical protein